MRLATILVNNVPRAVLQSGDSFVDINATDPSLPASVREILQQGNAALEALRRVAKAANAVRVAPADGKFLAPVTNPGKIVCLGLNYKDHAEESGAAIPREPILFSKYNNTLTGHGQPIILPPVSNEVDYEAELVIVIGTPGKNIAAGRALEHVAGYAVGHDVSARDWQLKKDGKQWMAGKTFDSFAPIGPTLVTADEVPDPHKLRIQLRLNGQTMQDSTTAQMIFNVPTTIAYLSQIFPLEPGDLIFTGTPPGVGFAKKPPLFLKGGDVAEVEIEGLGVLRNPVIQG